MLGLLLSNSVWSQGLTVITIKCATVILDNFIQTVVELSSCKAGWGLAVNSQLFIKSVTMQAYSLICKWIKIPLR